MHLPESCRVIDNCMRTQSDSESQVSTVNVNMNSQTPHTAAQQLSPSCQVCDDDQPTHHHPVTAAVLRNQPEHRPSLLRLTT
jgi:hypothetical protein